ncbi:MAG: radical SAM family heme chaperone HemW [Oscillospiraceae bacterium]|nr:radical SAM family heme chaperone HemW [Oscillospiraceae bacterium]
MTRAIGLYVHVPFCRIKCAYCRFYSVEYNKIAASNFAEAVIRNVLDFTKREHTVYDTVFFGGGTPSLLYAQIADIMRHVPLTEGAEVTVECNPCDVDSSMLQTLADAGVNRLSIGVQSLDDTQLRRLGRRHDARTAVAAVRQAADSKRFGALSVDVMLGVPGQTRDSLLDTLESVRQLPVTHISAYIYEPNVLEDDEVAELYLAAVEYLKRQGFYQYEISNFDYFADSKCRHNLKYWRCEEYVGIGPSAHSCYGGRRFAVPDDVDLFIRAPIQETFVTEPQACTRDERLMLGLRLCEGVTADSQLLERARAIPPELLNITHVGEEFNVSLTARGFLVSNQVIGALLS